VVTLLSHLPSCAFFKGLRSEKPTFTTGCYVLKESLDRLWTYRYEGAMLNYLQSWMNQLRWQRLRPFEKLAEMLLNHLEGISNYCRTKVPLGMVEAVNGNIKLHRRQWQPCRTRTG
jgi:transposase